MEAALNKVSAIRMLRIIMKYSLSRHKKIKLMLVVTISRSEIKFSVYAADKPLLPIFDGGIERIGTKNTAFSLTDNCTKRTINFCFFSTDYNDAVSFMLGLLQKQKSFNGVRRARFTLAAAGEKTLQNKAIETVYSLKSKAIHSTQYLPNENKMKELLQQRCPGIEHLICVDIVAATNFPAFSSEGNLKLQPQA